MRNQVTVNNVARTVKALALAGTYMNKRHAAARKRHMTYSRLANEAAGSPSGAFYIYCDRADRADAMARMTWAILLDRSLNEQDWTPCAW